MLWSEFFRPSKLLCELVVREYQNIFDPVFDFTASGKQFDHHLDLSGQARLVQDG